MFLHHTFTTMLQAHCSRIVQIQNVPMHDFSMDVVLVMDTATRALNLLAIELVINHIAKAGAIPGL